MNRNARPIPVILDLHCEDAAILWVRRDVGVNAPHYSRLYLSRLDEQLEAHLDGLRIAGPAGWEHAQAAFDSFPEPGEMFTLASLAFGPGGDAERIGTVLEAVGQNPETLIRPAISALGWLDPGAARAVIDGLLQHDAPLARQIGLGGASAQRYDPDAALAACLDDAPEVRARACRLAAELGRADLLHRIFVDRPDDTGDSRFWTFWAATMLGERDTAPVALLEVARAAGPRWELALSTAIPALGAEAGWQWLDTLDFEPHGLLQRIIGFGLLGDPQTIDWLISQMADPVLGRRAGEALCLITGLDLEFDDLDADAPEGFEAGPTDDPDDPNVARDPDEEVPWPDPVAVERHMRDFRAALPAGLLFLGRQRSPEALEHGLIHGYQRQRRAAAFALALRQPGAPLANWKQPVRDVTLH